MRYGFFLLLSVSVVLFYSSTIHAQEVKVIVHPSVTQQDIQRNTLRAIFGIRLRKWPDGTAIKVFVLQDDVSFHVKFSKITLHMFPYQLRRAWDRQVYSGTGQAPNEVGSVEEMRAKISTTPGAIGYLPTAESRNDKTQIDIKVLYVR